MATDPTGSSRFHAGAAAPIQDIVDSLSQPDFFTGFDHALHQGWRLVAGRPACEKEFSSKLSAAPTDDDSDPCKCIFPDGHVISLAEWTVGQHRARTGMPTTKGKAFFWSDAAGEWHVHIKKDRNLLAYCKGPKDKAQSCQARVDLFKHDEEVMVLMKKIAEEVIEGILAFEKDALYARRNLLLLEAGVRQAGVPTSKNGQRHRPQPQHRRARATRRWQHCQNWAAVFTPLTRVPWQVWTRILFDVTSNNHACGYQLAK